ncbi:hypothetical protein [Salegentibacter mishustinae]|uniref:DUF3575 domain-containing protein n=1 Tax=Salegentibacter mishustinae TaxID=270918 RepID=A0A0Q9ZE63_9FLAO|nr:hypothetical protein [Salegentibacter mishustinae]KRG30553.1 hypothetical protein APR42_01415 [Salegentibacter mishustinae]PNW23444.1 hypothetical protein APB85_01410 [Salegentibacter mishustinae]PZX66511.1 hypothetical protein LY54_00909 [Salegentibacter mishustinae]GGW82963.1 hypothetical protein GCM10008086_08720 [Salegentibacter mishustinae]
MKTKITTFLFLVLGIVCHAQDSPTLNLTGTNPSVSKGNIDTEVLTAIIQQKQEEIKERVFRNTIVKQFKDSDNNYTKKLNNFATFNYLYNLMDILTSGKNKTVMTKTAIENTAEFAFIFGLAYYTNKQTVLNAKVNLNNIDNNNKIRVNQTTNVEDFNLLVDLCYQIVIENEDKFQEQFKFKNSLENVNFRRWYESDNVFVLELKIANANNNTQRVTQLNTLKQTVTKSIEDILLVSNQTNELIEIGKKVNDAGLKNEIDILLQKITEANGSEISSEIDNLRIKYSNFLNIDQKNYLTKLSGLVRSNFDEYENLYDFYKSLEKSQFKDFTMTQSQYYSMKYLIVEFISVAKNQYPNDAISTVLEFLLENTLVEFNDLSGNLVDEVTNETKEIGYLYVDIESLISTIDQRFNSITKKKFTKYITPFFSMGVNYASFSNNNSLIDNESNSTSSIGSLYYASEKIGIKWKLWNWKYTHAFEAGESFEYYGKQTYWLRPQEEPLISDVYIYGYASGLLYNLVDLKSEENFDYALVGAGMGMTFFNGLSANLSISSPIVDNSISSKNSFVNLGLDIPIIEYISALTKKK